MLVLLDIRMISYLFQRSLHTFVHHITNSSLMLLGVFARLLSFHFDRNDDVSS